MNIPNILTIIRLLLIPVFVIVFYSQIDNNILYATYIFLIAGFTDFLDGYIARRYNMITKWGTVLDPLADKLMQLTVLICFTSARYIPIWAIIVIGAKELLMIFGGLFLYYFFDRTVIPANKYGKIATLAFYIAILGIAFNINNIANYILITITVGLTILAFGNYFIGFRTISMEKNRDKLVDN